MEATGSAVAKEQIGRRGYVESFARIMSSFTTLRSDELLANMPAQLVAHFNAARAELWLWDTGAGCGFLVHHAGDSAGHRHDYTTAGNGVAGAVAEGRKAAENLLVASFGNDEEEYAKRTGLTHVSAFPLLADNKLLGVLTAYSRNNVSEEVLEWWRMYAEVCGIKVGDVLTAQEQQKKITQLSLLFEATRLLNSTLDLAELLELILKIASTEVNADRGSVFLVDQEHKELWSIVASGLDHQEIRVPFGMGVAGRVGESGETVNTPDAYSLPYFEQGFDQKFGYRTRSLLCIPVRHHTGNIVGVIQLLNKKGGPNFTAEDEDFLAKLSGHMAMALENARLHRDALIKQRLEKELALARGIQHSLLPDAPPIIPGYDISVLNHPCFEVGGDYYDFLSLGPQSLLLVVADVEGKGVGSALVMSNLQATLRALVMHLHSLEVLALSLNEMIYNDTKSEKYLSIFLGLVDTRRNGLHYINAGHVPPLLIRSNGQCKTLDEGGTVIGLFPTAEYHRGTVKLEPGDILVCCTDGIPEACNEKEDEYGSERLADCIRNHRQKPAQAIVEAVLADVNKYAAGGKYTDDKVLMVMKVNGEGAFQTAVKPVAAKAVPGL
jgi:sigma-B regulation protein RsbU (phosphoserine phosphatase)